MYMARPGCFLRPLYIVPISICSTVPIILSEAVESLALTTLVVILYSKRRHKRAHNWCREWLLERKMYNRVNSWVFSWIQMKCTLPQSRIIGIVRWSSSEL